MEPNEFKLPLGVVGQVEITRMLRELNQLDDFFVAAEARKGGVSSEPPPRLTRLLNELAKDNRFNLLEKKHRVKLHEELEGVFKDAPCLHISFATEPPPKTLEQILRWLRDNIHPQALLQVGLQPTIAAGCMLRTPNKIFDMSLREYLKKQEPFLVQLIRGATNE